MVSPLKLTSTPPLVDFDLERPLWTVSILNDLDLAADGTKTHAMIAYVSHTIGDGASLAQVLAQLFDEDPATLSSVTTTPVVAHDEGLPIEVA